MDSSLVTPPASPERAAHGGAPHAAPMRCVADTIGTTDALEALVPEWTVLWRRAGGTPFQSPAWLLPWWRHVGEGTLATVALRDAEDGRLAGIAPLYVYRHPESGKRHLFPLGIATTDRIDLLVDPDCRASVLAALAAHLAERRALWDVAELPQLGADAAWLRVPWTGERTVLPAEPNPVLRLPARLAPAFAKRVRYVRNRVLREGFRIEVADAGNVHAFLDALFALHARRWSERDQAGVLADPRVQAWHREAAPQLLAAGLLRLVALTRDGAVMAALHCVADAGHVHDRHWYDYIGGFDLACRHHSPGTVLVAETVARATAEGAVACDFLRGTEAYKYRWGAVDEHMVMLQLR